MDEFFVSFESIFVEAENEDEAVRKAMNKIDRIEFSSGEYGGPNVMVERV